MTAVRWNMIGKLKEAAPNVEFHFSYGQATKDSRKVLKIKKSHANDAYALGTFHSKWRAHTRKWKKRRRNNRVLEKFSNAKYVDCRDKSVKSGAQLPCGRTKRSESRHGTANDRVHRAMRVVKKTKTKCTVSKGRRSIRRQRYDIQPGDIVMYQNRRAVADGMHNKGRAVMVNGKSVPVTQVRLLGHAGGWIKTN